MPPPSISSVLRSSLQDLQLDQMSVPYLLRGPVHLESLPGPEPYLTQMACHIGTAGGDYPYHLGRKQCLDQMSVPYLLRGPLHPESTLLHKLHPRLSA